MTAFEVIDDEGIFEMQLKKAKRAAKRIRQVYEREEHSRKKISMLRNDDIDEMYAQYIRNGYVEDDVLEYEA